MDLLEKVLKLEQEANDFGFAWEKPGQIMDQIESECQEVREHLKTQKWDEALQEEIGDLLHAVFSLCVFCHYNPRETLKNTVKKFEKRLLSVQEIAHEKGLDNLKGQSFNALMTIWNEAKQRVG